jgi:hypothetical protein
VAVTVTSRLTVTVGAVSSPEEEIVPAVVLQVTFVLKLPVPLTDAVHWLVPPDVTEEGKQLTLTLVMVELVLDPPLPPQAAIQSTPVKTRKSPTLRTMILPA